MNISYQHVARVASKNNPLKEDSEISLALPSTPISATMLEVYCFLNIYLHSKNNNCQVPNAHCFYFLS